MNTFNSGYQIRFARIEDLATLAEIERAAAILFQDTPYAFLVDAEPLPLDVVMHQFQAERVWVAVDADDTPVGYAIAQEIDGNAYLQQIDVHPAHGRRGIGSKLVENIGDWAKHQNYHRILLSTFREIEWNAPFYAKLGFQVLAEAELTPGFQQIRRKEAEMGLPIDQRVIMYRELQLISSEQKLSLIGTPLAELEIDLPLVYGLLKEQHPDLAHLPLQLIDAGWDNTMFRLGDHLSVRLPRRAVAATLLENEQTWLPRLADYLTIPVPTLYRLGNPTQSYPWRWSVLPWLPGVTSDQEEPQANQAERFAAFLRSLHIPAPSNAPHNPVRGVPLHQRAGSIEERMQRLETKTNLITPEIKQIWNQAVNAPNDVHPTWLHGDLHARNVLVENGVITGIIDWGDMTSGDHATDLAAIWMIFSERKSRRRAIAEYGNISEATLQRARGWAILFGVVLLDTGFVDNPQHTVMGERTLRRVAEDG